MRSGDRGAWEEATADPVLRAGVLRVVQYDRRDQDLPLLRFLLEHENTARTEWFEARRPAAVLVASYGRQADVPLLRSATTGQVTDRAGAVEWARAEEAKRYGRDAARRRASSPGSSRLTGRVVSSTPGWRSSACWTRRVRSPTGSGS